MYIYTCISPETSLDTSRLVGFATYAQYTYNHMSPEFDPRKDASNIAKHGVPLSEGDGVLRDTLAITVEDDSAEGEPRWVTIGANVFGSVMVVVWTQRDADVRLISVRRAEPKERRAYEEGI